mgnify:CR=1 FL=1
MNIEIPEGYEAVEIEYYKSGQPKRVKLKKVEAAPQQVKWPELPHIPYLPVIPTPDVPNDLWQKGRPSEWWQRPQWEGQVIITPDTLPPVPRTYGLPVQK